MNATTTLKTDLEIAEMKEELYAEVIKFMAEQHVTCVETIHQTDHVIESAYEFLERLFKIVESDLDIVRGD